MLDAGSGAHVSFGGCRVHLIRSLAFCLQMPFPKNAFADNAFAYKRLIAAYTLGMCSISQSEGFKIYFTVFQYIRQL